MHDFENLSGFLEHVSLVMDADKSNDGDRVSIMTLHARRSRVRHSIPHRLGEGLFPHQRALDEQGAAGLEEERRLAYVGITRARKQAHVSLLRTSHAWPVQAATPSRFVDELPEAHVECGRPRARSAVPMRTRRASTAILWPVALR